MHLILLDRWTQLESPLHRLDPRSKIVAVGALIVFLALSTAGLAFKCAAAGALLVSLVVLSRIPLGYCLARACLVLPFSAMAVAASLAGRWLPGPYFSGALSPAAALGVVAKSYLSAMAVLLLVATTRLPDLLRGLGLLRLPTMFLMIVQFLYRYLFVLSEEAQHMTYARQSRGGGSWARGGLRAAGASIAVLFARAYARAERIHRAMLARGYAGLLPSGYRFCWSATETALLFAMAGYLAAVEAASLYLG
jgi:cobalt/nickel transport system permease protein